MPTLELPIMEASFAFVATLLLTMIFIKTQRTKILSNFVPERSLILLRYINAQYATLKTQQRACLSPFSDILLIVDQT